MSTTLTPTSFKTGRRINVLWSSLALTVVAIIGALIHSYNMFGFPVYFGDEGIYMAQAYAVAKLGVLTPYTYWYDHAPAGWLLIAVWTVFTGGFHTFGTAVDGGRVLMLLLHIASLMLIFRISLKLTGNLFAATTAGLLFTLSPLTVIYGRLVLLDNIMVFWVLVAVTLFIENEGKIWPLLFSGFFFGVAVLTKESALLLFPAFIYASAFLIEKHHARFARAAWLFASLATISLYALYAWLRGELINLSLSTPLAGNGDSPVSLFGSIIWQLSRSGGAPWDPSSDFYRLLMTDWLAKDPWLLGIGAAAVVWNLFRGGHFSRFMALAALGTLIGLARGGIVLEFYVLFALPFLALNVALALHNLARSINATAVLLPAAALLALLIGYVNLRPHTYAFTVDQTSIQRQALSWMQENAPVNAQIVGDDDIFVDMRFGAPGEPSFRGYHSHWKVANDPAVYRTLFSDDWRNLDYLVVTPEMVRIFEENPDRLPYQAYINSTEVASFTLGDDQIAIRQVIKPEDSLNDAYMHFKERFLDNGQIRLAGAGYVDARHQATALLMAVWMDDQDAFDTVWEWTKTNLQQPSGLLSQTNDPDAAGRTATDADVDAALALILAERRWNYTPYGDDARVLLDALWDNVIIKVNGVPYAAAGNWGVTANQLIFAPATFAPYAYHVFATYDTDNEWWYLLDTSYELVAEVMQNSLIEPGSVGLPPVYVGIDRNTGAISLNPVGAPGPGRVFNAEAAQIFWRVGLDAQWHEDERAVTFLQQSSFLLDEYRANGALAASYANLGRSHDQIESLVMYSAVLPQFIAQDPDLAAELYATKIVNAGTGVAADGELQVLTAEQARWSWLAIGLYDQALGNSWGEELTPDATTSTPADTTDGSAAVPAEQATPEAVPADQ